MWTAATREHSKIDYEKKGLRRLTILVNVEREMWVTNKLACAKTYGMLLVNI